MSNEALVAEVAKLSSTLNDFGDYRTGTADYLEGLVDRLADALEAAERDKREAQAEALEAAADAALRLFANKPGAFSHWLRARAAEIREGRA